MAKERLNFSARARRAATRRRRMRHIVLALWLTCVLGAVAGIPFANVGAALTGDLIARIEPAVGGIETSESAVGIMRFRTASFKTRPTPSPSPSETEEAEPAYVPPTGSIAEIIYAAGAEFGIDGGYLLAIASCESGLNVYAHNPAGYYGLFQFDQGTWAAYGYGSIYDAAAQVRTAARLIAAGQASRWPSCA